MSQQKFTPSNPLDNGRVPVTPNDGRPDPPIITTDAHLKTAGNAVLICKQTTSFSAAPSESDDGQFDAVIGTPSQAIVEDKYKDFQPNIFLYDTWRFDMYEYEYSDWAEADKLVTRHLGAWPELMSEAAVADYSPRVGFTFKGALSWTDDSAMLFFPVPDVSPSLYIVESPLLGMHCMHMENFSWEASRIYHEYIAANDRFGTLNPPIIQQTPYLLEVEESTLQNLRWSGIIADKQEVGIVFTEMWYINTDTLDVAHDVTALFVPGCPFRQDDFGFADIVDCLEWTDSDVFVLQPTNDIIEIHDQLLGRWDGPMNGHWIWYWYADLPDCLEWTQGDVLNMQPTNDIIELHDQELGRWDGPMFGHWIWYWDATDPDTIEVITASQLNPQWTYESFELRHQELGRFDGPVFGYWTEYWLGDANACEWFNGWKPAEEGHIAVNVCTPLPTDLTTWYTLTLKGEVFILPSPSVDMISIIIPGDILNTVIEVTTQLTTWYTLTLDGYRSKIEPILAKTEAGMAFVFDSSDQKMGLYWLDRRQPMLAHDIDFFELSTAHRLVIEGNSLLSAGGSLPYNLVYSDGVFGGAYNPALGCEIHDQEMALEDFTLHFTAYFDAHPPLDCLEVIQGDIFLGQWIYNVVELHEQELAWADFSEHFTAYFDALPPLDCLIIIQGDVLVPTPIYRVAYKNVPEVQQTHYRQRRGGLVKGLDSLYKGLITREDFLFTNAAYAAHDQLMAEASCKRLQCAFTGDFADDVRHLEDFYRATIFKYDYKTTRRGHEGDDIFNIHGSNVLTIGYRGEYALDMTERVPLVSTQNELSGTLLNVLYGAPKLEADETVIASCPDLLLGNLDIVGADHVVSGGLSDYLIRYTPYSFSGEPFQHTAAFADESVSAVMSLGFSTEYDGIIAGEGTFAQAVIGVQYGVIYGADRITSGYSSVYDIAVYSDGAYTTPSFAGFASAYAVEGISGEVGYNAAGSPTFMATAETEAISCWTLRSTAYISGRAELTIGCSGTYNLSAFIPGDETLYSPTQGWVAESVPAALSHSSLTYFDAALSEMAEVFSNVSFRADAVWYEDHPIGVAYPTLGLEFNGTGADGDVGVSVVAVNAMSVTGSDILVPGGSAPYALSAVFSRTESNFSLLHMQRECAAALAEFGFTATTGGFEFNGVSTDYALGVTVSGIPYLGLNGSDELAIGWEESYGLRYSEGGYVSDLSLYSRNQTHADESLFGTMSPNMGFSYEGVDTASGIGVIVPDSAWMNIYGNDIITIGSSQRYILGFGSQAADNWNAFGNFGYAYPEGLAATLDLAKSAFSADAITVGIEVAGEFSAVSGSAENVSVAESMYGKLSLTEGFGWDAAIGDWWKETYLTELDALTIVGKAFLNVNETSDYLLYVHQGVSQHWSEGHAVCQFLGELVFSRHAVVAGGIIPEMTCAEDTLSEKLNVLGYSSLVIGAQGDYELQFGVRSYDIGSSASSAYEVNGEPAKLSFASSLPLNGAVGDWWRAVYLGVTNGLDISGSPVLTIGGSASYALTSRANAYGSAGYAEYGVEAPGHVAAVYSISPATQPIQASIVEFNITFSETSFSAHVSPNAVVVESESTLLTTLSVYSENYGTLFVDQAAMTGPPRPTPGAWVRKMGVYDPSPALYGFDWSALLRLPDSLYKGMTVIKFTEVTDPAWAMTLHEAARLDCHGHSSPDFSSFAPTDTSVIGIVDYNYADAFLIGWKPERSYMAKQAVEVAALAGELTARKDFIDGIVLEPIATQSNSVTEMSVYGLGIICAGGKSDYDIIYHGDWDFSGYDGRYGHEASALPALWQPVNRQFAFDAVENEVSYAYTVYDGELKVSGSQTITIGHACDYALAHVASSFDLSELTKRYASTSEAYFAEIATATPSILLNATSLDDSTLATIVLEKFEGAISGTDTLTIGGIGSYGLSVRSISAGLVPGGFGWHGAHVTEEVPVKVCVSPNSVAKILGTVDESNISAAPVKAGIDIFGKDTLTIGMSGEYLLSASAFVSGPVSAEDVCVAALASPAEMSHTASLLIPAAVWDGVNTFTVGVPAAPEGSVWVSDIFPAILGTPRPTGLYAVDTSGSLLVTEDAGLSVVISGKDYLAAGYSAEYALSVSIGEGSDAVSGNYCVTFDVLTALIHTTGSTKFSGITTDSYIGTTVSVLSVMNIFGGETLTSGSSAEYGMIVTNSDNTADLSAYLRNSAFMDEAGAASLSTNSAIDFFATGEPFYLGVLVREAGEVKIHGSDTLSIGARGAYDINVTTYGSGSVFSAANMAQVAESGLLAEICGPLLTFALPANEVGIEYASVRGLVPAPFFEGLVNTHEVLTGIISLTSAHGVPGAVGDFWKESTVTDFDAVGIFGRALLPIGYGGDYVLAVHQGVSFHWSEAHTVDHSVAEIDFSSHASVFPGVETSLEATEDLLASILSISGPDLLTPGFSSAYLLSTRSEDRAVYTGFWSAYENVHEAALYTFKSGITLEGSLGDWWKEISLGQGDLLRISGSAVLSIGYSTEYALHVTDRTFGTSAYTTSAFAASGEAAMLDLNAHAVMTPAALWEPGYMPSDIITAPAPVGGAHFEPVLAALFDCSHLKLMFEADYCIGLSFESGAHCPGQWIKPDRWERRNMMQTLYDYDHTAIPMLPDSTYKGFTGWRYRMTDSAAWPVLEQEAAIYSCRDHFSADLHALVLSGNQLDATVDYNYADVYIVGWYNTKHYKATYAYEVVGYGAMQCCGLGGHYSLDIPAEMFELVATDDQLLRHVDISGSDRITAGGSGDYGLHYWQNIYTYNFYDRNQAWEASTQIDSPFCNAHDGLELDGTEVDSLPVGHDMLLRRLDIFGPGSISIGGLSPYDLEFWMPTGTNAAPTYFGYTAHESFGVSGLMKCGGLGSYFGAIQNTIESVFDLRYTDNIPVLDEAWIAASQLHPLYDCWHDPVIQGGTHFDASTYDQRFNILDLIAYEDRGHVAAEQLHPIYCCDHYPRVWGGTYNECWADSYYLRAFLSVTGPDGVAVGGRSSYMLDTICFPVNNMPIWKNPGIVDWCCWNAQLFSFCSNDHSPVVWGGTHFDAHTNFYRPDLRITGPDEISVAGRAGYVMELENIHSYVFQRTDGAATVLSGQLVDTPCKYGFSAGVFEATFFAAHTHDRIPAVSELTWEINIVEQQHPMGCTGEFFSPSFFGHEGDVSFTFETQHAVATLLQDMCAGVAQDQVFPFKPCCATQNFSFIGVLLDTLEVTMQDIFLGQPDQYTAVNLEDYNTFAGELQIRKFVLPLEGSVVSEIGTVVAELVMPHLVDSAPELTDQLTGVADYFKSIVYQPGVSPEWIGAIIAQPQAQLNFEEAHTGGLYIYATVKASLFWHCNMWADELNAVIPAYYNPKTLYIPMIPDLDFWFDFEEDSRFTLSFIF